MPDLSQNMHNRAIEFRAWHIETKQMFEVETLSSPYVYQKYIEGKTTFFNYKYKREECYLLQFTGYFDSKGAKIFDGDIIRMPWKCTQDELDGGDNHVCGYHHVIFYKGCWCLAGSDLDGGIEPDCDLLDAYCLDENHDLTIIGNDYENPDMLKLLDETFPYDHDPFKVHEEQVTNSQTVLQ